MVYICIKWNVHDDVLCFKESVEKSKTERKLDRKKTLQLIVHILCLAHRCRPITLPHHRWQPGGKCKHFDQCKDWHLTRHCPPRWVVMFNLTFLFQSQTGTRKANQVWEKPLMSFFSSTLMKKCPVEFKMPSLKHPLPRLPLFLGLQRPSVTLAAAPAPFSSTDSWLVLSSSDQLKQRSKWTELPDGIRTWKSQSPGGLAGKKLVSISPRGRMCD